MQNRNLGSLQAKITPQRSKGRQKKEKPVFNTPTILKVKIPPVKATSTDTGNQQSNKPKFAENDMKLTEVIRAQVPKKLSLTKEPIKEILDDKPHKTAITKKPILNLKYVLRNSIMVVEENNTEDCKKKPVKRGVHKILTKPINSKLTDNLQPEDPGENIASTKPIKKGTSKPVKLRRRKVVMQGVDAQDEANVSPENKDQPPKPKSRAKHKLSVKSEPGPITRTRKLNGVIKKVEEDLTKLVPEEEKEIPIVKQKYLLNSRSSSMSELSWTKDISSSSTTFVTVSSQDFFRIDKKLPIIKLANIDCKLKYSNQMCVNVSDSVCAENNDSKVQSNCENDIDIPSLNLSTSSASDCSQEDQSPKKVISKLDKALIKLSSKLNSFDLEVINWIGFTNENANSNIDILNNKMFQGGFLQEEKDVILTCKEINRLFSNNPKVDNKTKMPVTNEVSTTSVNSVKISSELVLNEDLQNEESKKANSTETDKDFNNFTGKQNNSFEDNDDDDALSLFAESITGIDFSRKNSSVAGILDIHEDEEYIPEPVLKNNLKSPEITYRPSRIASIARSEAVDNKIITCEKQNADSTSIYRENENYVYNNIVYEDRIGDFSKTATQFNGSGIQRNSSPRFMASIHKQKQGIHSYVFRGVCFFYLISSCKKPICNFPHSIIEIDDVKKKLALISENLFVEEYMMVRTWPELRRMYGKCFVAECIRRELSRFLVEMAIDFVVKANENSRDDNVLKIDVVESTLLYLNKVDLSTCADLLKYKVQHFTRVLLCDFFMNTIAESQNFSRFKTVFINLTEFMCNIQRTFDINVATVILERVSILPYDEGLARALLKIIKHTDTTILSNTMIGILEMQLMSSNLGLYDELMSLHGKTYTNHTAIANCYHKTSIEGTASIKNNNLLTNNDIRYSPDTTNLDNVNKTLEPIITRTTDLKKTRPQLNDTMNKSNNESCKIKYNNWTKRTVFDNIRYKRLSQTMMPPKWAGYKRRSDRNLETRPSKYQRIGPSFSQDFL